jgi:hypothetical protein
MAFCYISEYPGGPPMGSQAPAEPALAEQTVAIGASSAQSQPFGGGTKMIRVSVDATCSIAIGPDPTAMAPAKRLSANQTEFFIVQPGHRLAVIQNT